MPVFMCLTCGSQHDESTEPPALCAICEDERQYVPEQGQRWTTMESLAGNHRIVWQEHEPDLHSLRIAPHFGIGQRAFLIRHESGNILWDCLSLIDRETVERIEALGGISAIAISHPHYYSSMLEWSAAFGNVPIHIHADDSQWVQRHGEAVQLWHGETLGVGAATMIRCGGHFEGACVLHSPWLANGKGALMSGDTIQVVPDRKHVSFMYSYPNLIPLDESRVRRIVGSVANYAFEIVHGAFDGRTIASDGKGAVERSAARYLASIGSNSGGRA